MSCLQEEDSGTLAMSSTISADSTRSICIHHLVSQPVASIPDAPALVAQGQVVSYRELDQRSNRIARYLCSLGVGPEVPVGICLERSLDLLIGLLGILKSGGAYVPLDPTYPADRLAFMVNDAQTPVLITRQALLDKLPPTRAHLVCLDRDQAELSSFSVTEPEVAVTHDNLAYIIYTSGSTGQPKGVEITHGGLFNLVNWHQQAFTLTSADRATLVSSPAFDAMGWELWPYLCCGASVYVSDDETRIMPEKLRDWLLQQKITISFLPTPLAERILTLVWPASSDLRFLLTGADTLHLYPAPGLPFVLVNNYGPTEATVVATSGPVMASANTTTPPSIGYPIANVETYILDEELRPVPYGNVGELYLGGSGLARGYHRRPELTTTHFIAHPFNAQAGSRLYKTGDMARYLPDGRLAFLGRSDQQVKIRGYRIELDEIATVLNNHPALHTSVVMARENEIHEKQLVAYIVPADTAISVQILCEYLATYLPDYMIPTLFVVLDKLSQTTNGKVDRASLPVPTRDNILSYEVAASPLTSTEQRVSGIVSSLLGLEQVAVEDNFFMLGGHSLLGTQIIARVKEIFQVELPLRSLFESPTVRLLSQEIEQRILASNAAIGELEVQQCMSSDAPLSGKDR
jgi:amino acid adenylation domain-containing protein